MRSSPKVLNPQSSLGIFQVISSAKPPLNAHFFAIPDGNNFTSEQVFGYNDMYRFISTPRILEAAQNVIHPTAQASIRRDLAMGFL